MATEQVFEKITNGIRTGLPHPGNPDTDQPPMTFVLPGFDGKGLPPELGEHITATARMVAEAIVALIEADNEIVPTAEIARLRRIAADAPQRNILIVCRKCSQPLVAFVYNGDSQISVDPKPMLTTLANRNSACPHELR